MTLPDWIRIKNYDKKRYQETLDVIDKHSLVTVCQEANCPNRYECFSCGTATFMILGDVCARNCAYCNIKKGQPKAVDSAESERIAAAVKRMGLDYAVITCVARDDLSDGGAGQFVKTIKAIKRKSPECKIEILISDLRGNWPVLAKIVKAGPDVINHNLETVADIFGSVRPKGDYEMSLRLLKKVKEISPEMKTKSGFMVGMGETEKQIIETLRDLKKTGCDILTVGQYLRPSSSHLSVKKYYRENEFGKIASIAKKLGIKKAVAGSLVRSSYKAKNFAGSS